MPLPKSADDLMRRGSSDRSPFPELVARAADDPAIRERVEKLYLLTRERVRKHEKWFEAFAERGRVVELSGTHDLIISNPREVLQQIEAFISTLSPRSAIRDARSLLVSQRDHRVHLRRAVRRDEAGARAPPPSAARPRRTAPPGPTPSIRTGSSRAL